MYGRCDRPFFLCGLAPDSRRQATRYTHGAGAHVPMHWSDTRLIAYIRTCARVLLM